MKQPFARCNVPDRRSFFRRVREKVTIKNEGTYRSGEPTDRSPRRNVEQEGGGDQVLVVVAIAPDGECVVVDPAERPTPEIVPLNERAPGRSILRLPKVVSSPRSGRLQVTTTPTGCQIHPLSTIHSLLGGMLAHRESSSSNAGSSFPCRYDVGERSVKSCPVLGSEMSSRFQSVPWTRRRRLPDSKNATGKSVCSG